jgi:hypothetical protein
MKAPCPRCGKSFLKGGALTTHVNHCGREQEHFWAKVDKEAAGGCWVYTGYRQKFGHGWTRYGLAHRFAWTLLRGPIPQDKCLLHSCDNPPCVNPEHLFIGDRVSNMKDKCAKGRYRHRYVPIDQMLHPHLSRRRRG